MRTNYSYKFFLCIFFNNKCLKLNSLFQSTLFIHHTEHFSPHLLMQNPAEFKCRQLTIKRHEDSNKIETKDRYFL